VTRRAGDAPDPYGNGVTLTSRGTDGWRVRWFEPPDSRRIEDRRQKSFGPSRLDDARDFAHELSDDLGLRGVGAGDRRARRATPWRDVYARWLHVKTTGGDWSPSNADQVRQLQDKWAEPILGQLPLASIQRDDYQLVLAALHEAGRDGSHDRVRSLLAQLERWAVDAGYCDPRRFPVRSSPRRPEGGQAGADEQFVPQHLRPEPARVERLRRAAAEVGRPPRWWRSVQVDVAARSGLRLGEQLALRSCGIDLEAGTIQVNWEYISEPVGRTCSSAQRAARPAPRSCFRQWSRTSSAAWPRSTVSVSPPAKTATGRAAGCSFRRPGVVRRDKGRVGTQPRPCRLCGDTIRSGPGLAVAPRHVRRMDSRMAFPAPRGRHRLPRRPPVTCGRRRALAGSLGAGAPSKVLRTGGRNA
jgi:hypothetical protein